MEGRVLIPLSPWTDCVALGKLLPILDLSLPIYKLEVGLVISKVLPASELRAAHQTGEAEGPQAGPVTVALSYCTSLNYSSHLG